MLLRPVEMVLCERQERELALDFSKPVPISEPGELFSSLLRQRFRPLVLSGQDRRLPEVGSIDGDSSNFTGFAGHAQAFLKIRSCSCVIAAVESQGSHGIERDVDLSGLASFPPEGKALLQQSLGPD